MIYEKFSGRKVENDCTTGTGVVKHGSQSLAVLLLNSHKYSTLLQNSTLFGQTTKTLHLKWSFDTIQYFFSKNFHENGVKFPEEKNALGLAPTWPP